MEILSTSQQIRQKIRWVFGDANDERIILVAYVGRDALDYLDKPAGIHLYCWLKIPGTNPTGLRNLKNNDVDLFAVQNLHMKLYWSRKRGAVLGSANLSKNAFGDDRLFELAVYLPPKTINVEQLLKRFTAIPIGDSMIDEFERRHNLYRLRNQDENLQYTKRESHVPNFLEWRNSRRKSKGEQFSLYWWWEEDNPPKDALQTVKRETGSERYHDFMNSWSENNYKPGSWVLSFRVSEHQDGDIHPLRLEWFIPEVYAKTQNKRWGKANHIWFQIGKRLPAVPFSLKDPIFKRALTDVLIQNENDVENVVMKNSMRPTEQFLRSLEQHYRELKSTNG